VPESQSVAVSKEVSFDEYLQVVVILVWVEVEVESRLSGVKSRVLPWSAVRWDGYRIESVRAPDGIKVMDQVGLDVTPNVDREIPVPQGLLETSEFDGPQPRLGWLPEIGWTNWPFEWQWCPVVKPEHTRFELCNPVSHPVDIGIEAWYRFDRW
jgi:hypothetical protein